MHLTHRSFTLRSLGGIAVLIALAATPLGVGGCFNPFSPQIAPVRGKASKPPVPDSPDNALRFLEWCYNNRSYSDYEEVFSADYRFAFSALDSAGNQYRDQPWTREDEMAYAKNLFLGGGADQPPASSILLQLDKSFFVYDDFRPEHAGLGTWYKNIRTNVSLSIRTSDGNAIDINGAANFFLVRGDSALIPAGFESRLPRDANHWYIQRWEDETAQQGPGTYSARPALPASARSVSAPAARGAGRFGAVDDWNPIVRASWGAVKIFYKSR